jgi:membrane-associated phospholipid phosphatase
MASLWKVSCNFSRFFLLTYCILIGISRIVIGLHFPADIIGGYLMGILTVLGARKLLQHHAFSFLR